MSAAPRVTVHAERQAAVRQARRRALAQLAGLGLLATLSAAPAAASDLSAVIAVLKPSVLPVGSYSATGNPRFAFRGSGFVVEGNLLATNYHVLPDAADTDPNVQMAVSTSRVNASGEMQVRMARVVATDRVRDLALLQFDDAPALPPLTMAEPGTAREGQSIALMGFPMGGALGFAAVTHRGIIASITTAALPAPTARQLDARALVRLRDGNFEVLQLDATAYPGNSGGPVFDAETGRVMGIVNQVLVRTSRESALSAPSGITYAIPISQVQELLREYKAKK